MKTACFIPIKENSERIPGKNLRLLNGKKLYQYICENAKSAEVFDDIYIDGSLTVKLYQKYLQATSGLYFFVKFLFLWYSNI